MCRKCLELCMIMVWFDVSVVLIVLVLCVFLVYDMLLYNVMWFVFLMKFVLLMLCRIMLLVLVSSMRFCVLVICVWRFFIIGWVCENSVWFVLSSLCSVMCDSGEKLGCLCVCRLIVVECVCVCVSRLVCFVVVGSMKGCGMMCFLFLGLLGLIGLELVVECGFVCGVLFGVMVDCLGMYYYISVMCDV